MFPETTDEGDLLIANDENIIDCNIFSNFVDDSGLAIKVESGADDTRIGENQFLRGYPDEIDDNGTRTTINGQGDNGSDDPPNRWRLER